MAKKSSGPVKGLRNARVPPDGKHQNPPVPEDPIKGLKMALKAGDVQKLAEAVAALGSGTL